MPTQQTYSSNILGRRLLVRSIAALLIILAGSVVADLWFAEGRKIRESRDDLVRRIDSIEPLIVQALWRIDPESIRVALHSIGASPGVARASLRAQFRINDINERFIVDGFEQAECSDRIMRDYSGRIFRGMEIGSGTLNICFSNRLIAPNYVSLSLGDGLFKNFTVAAVMALVLFLLITRSTIRPVNQIIARVHEAKLRSRGAPKRDGWDRGDEIDELFSQLVEKERAVDRLHRNDKLRILGVLASGVAHDFNNVLAVILGHAELLSVDKDKDPDMFEQRVRTLICAAGTGAAMTRRLQLLSRKAPEQFKTTCLQDVLRNVESFVTLLVNTPNNAVRIAFALNTDCKILVDPGGLEAALLNLVLNARDAVAECDDAYIEVSASDLCVNGQKEVQIRVWDNGEGMSPKVLERVTEPFFTTKQDRGGSGLGLAMVSGFVKRSGGRIEIRSETGSGTSVILAYPAIASPISDDLPDREPLPAEIERSAHKVLVIDDERHLAESISMLLNRLGYSSDYAIDALQVMNDAATLSRYDLVVSDILMGAITGPELREHINSVLGDAAPPMLFISGAVPDSFSKPVQEEIKDKVIYKPFDIQTLDLRIQQVLDQTPRGPREAPLLVVNGSG